MPTVGYLITRQRVLDQLAGGALYVSVGGHVMYTSGDVPDDATLQSWAAVFSATYIGSPTTVNVTASVSNAGTLHSPLSVMTATSTPQLIVPARPTRRYAIFTNTDAQTLVWIVPPNAVEINGQAPANSTPVSPGQATPQIPYTGEMWVTIDPTTGSSAIVSVLDVFD